MSRGCILVIEDEEDILEVIEYNLKKEGYSVVKALDGEGGITLAREKVPLLILLDRMLPGMDGTEVCLKLKGDPLTREIPVIMLTAKTEESDIVLGLSVGADDYVNKPFRPKELFARINAVLRRVGSGRARQPETAISAHGIRIDPIRHEVLVGNEPVELTATEFRILHLLASQPGRVFSREQIASKALDTVYLPSERGIDVHMMTIRRKLGDFREVVETVRGVGYRFSDLKSLPDRT